MKNLNTTEIQGISGGNTCKPVLISSNDIHMIRGIPHADYSKAYGVVGGVAPCVMVPVYEVAPGLDYFLPGVKLICPQAS